MYLIFPAVVAATGLCRHDGWTSGRERIAMALIDYCMVMPLVKITCAGVKPKPERKNELSNTLEYTLVLAGEVNDEKMGKTGCK